MIKQCNSQSGQIIKLKLWALIFLLLIITDNSFTHSQEHKEFDMNYLPDIFLSGASKEGNLPLLNDKFVAGQTTIYVCRDKSCKLPVASAEDAIKQIVK